jgi:3-oxosteroid 1-dehydrogenase
MQLPFYKQSWKSKALMVKVGVRGALAKLTGKHWVTAGAALQGRMLQAALKAGVDMRVEVGVKNFIVENGAVTGVVSTRDGRDWRIGAKLGVLVNAGGFAHNQAMLDKYIPGVSAKWTASNPGDTGEMLQELIKLGAATAQLEEMVGNQMAIPPGCENKGDGLALGAVGGQMNIAKPHSIIVDRTGVRYMNEGGSYMAFCKNMLERDKVAPAVPSWWIVDEQYMRDYMFCGAMPGAAKPKAWFDQGFLKKADTLEDLARQCQIPPAALKATVARFNADVEAGRDAEFHRGDRAYDNWLGDPFARPSATLGKIETGPFYAAQVVPGNVGTYGGVVTDTYARVLREDGQPIPGLYATGNTTASVMGRFYPGAGSSIGPSFTWGYVAAKHAAGADNWAG